MQDEASFAGGSLCVVGNINRDIKTAPFKAGEHLFQDGETSVPAISETVGGGGANSAFAAAALGGRVTFLGKVGADALGDRLERTLNQHRVHACLARDTDHPTGTSIGLAYENGHRHFVSCLPASRALRGSDLNLEVLAGHDHLLRADVWFSEAMLMEGNQVLFETARRQGLTVSLDLNWDPCWGVASSSELRTRKNAVRRTLPWVNLVHGNGRELMEFSDAESLETALKRLQDWGAESVVVHLGAQGAGFHGPEGWIQEPPAPVSVHVHNTGTGDVLSVCMMLLHHRGEFSLRERLRLANATVARFIEGRLSLIPLLAD